LRYAAVRFDNQTKYFFVFVGGTGSVERKDITDFAFDSL
jgi:hypothetical protein